MIVQGYLINMGLEGNNQPDVLLSIPFSCLLGNPVGYMIKMLQILFSDSGKD